jgi:hypothetical protein
VLIASAMIRQGHEFEPHIELHILFGFFRSP